jgi:fructoselysine-6-P-deglycase FrlB-like protein
MSTETEQKVVPTEVKPGELLADTDKDLVGSSVMISYSRKGQPTDTLEAKSAIRLLLRRSHARASHQNREVGCSGRPHKFCI